MSKSSIQPGDRFGKLSAVERADRVSPSGRRRAYWRCACDCGADHVVRNDVLTGGVVRACPECSKPPEDLWSKLFSQVDKVSQAPCWVWTGTRSTGYGCVSLRTGEARGRMVRVHRLSWELHFGPIPPGDHYGTMCVCHKCDNKACMNPDHLFLGTHADNMADMKRKGRAVSPQIPASRHGSKTKPHRVLRGDAHPSARLSRDAVLDIRRRVAAGEMQKTLAEEYGLTSGHVSQVISRKIWTHLP